MKYKLTERNGNWFVSMKGWVTLFQWKDLNEWYDTRDDALDSIHLGKHDVTLIVYEVNDE